MGLMPDSLWQAIGVMACLEGFYSEFLNEKSSISLPGKERTGYGAIMVGLSFPPPEPSHAGKEFCSFAI